ncbi:MAG: hypothetical protein ACRDPY_08605 [Streptosporangiaceae bacterium]
MDGPQHWAEADLILTGDPCEYGCPHSGCAHELRMIARAQVHATLARTALAAAAESVRLGVLPPAALEAWRDVAAGPEPGPEARL